MKLAVASAIGLAMSCIDYTASFAKTEPGFDHTGMDQFLCEVWPYSTSADSTIHYLLSSEADNQPLQEGLANDYANAVGKKADFITRKLAAKQEKMIAQLKKQQQKVARKLAKKDSLAASQYLQNANQQWNQLQAMVNGNGIRTRYIPFLDTLKASLDFLTGKTSQLKAIGGQLTDVQQSLEKVTQLQQQFAQADIFSQFLDNQQNDMMALLNRFGMNKELQQISREVYYYKQQVNDYREMLADTRRLERKAIELLSNQPQFRAFMQKNSILAGLFNMPSDNPDDLANLTNLAGLQTRTQIMDLIKEELGTGSEEIMRQFHENSRQAHDLLQEMKDKANQLGANGEGAMPNFTPNNQKTKSFRKRLEVGTNLQTLRSSGYFPTTSDLGLSLGFKLSDKGIIGLGASYKMGWGKDIQHIQISHQGLGVRSFLDYKIKQSFWVSGGFEMNYRTVFSSIEQLKGLSSWQSSGLIGVSKKIPYGAKFVKNSKVQLLWDFMSYYQVPRTQPLIFRVGYSIK